jgi:putative MATE family efflux protein
MNKTNDNKLGTEKIGKLVFSLALPAVIAQMVNVLYNIVDRMYIGHIPKIGSVALTGLGVCFPILMLISAFSAFVGSGGAPLASIQLGKGNKAEAEKILGNGVTMLIAFSIILTTIFMIFKEPLLYTFGASDNTIKYSLEYITIYLCGTVFVQASIGLNTFITCQGQAKVAMLSVLIGAIINIVLDPIFIFGFNLGVSGAALATVISQACSAVWVVAFLLSKRSSLRIKVSNLKPNWRIIGGITALGISPFIMQATESLINIVFNSGLKHYGNDVYVGSMTILQSVMQLFVMPTQGITMGTQPIISYNYGSKNHQRIKEAFRYTLIATLTITFIATISVSVYPQVFARMFTRDQELITVVVKVLPIFMAGIWIFGVQMACQSAFMGMGQAKISLFLALLRKVILLIPLALILPRFTGVMGIYYAEPIADIIAAVTTGTLFTLNFKKILSNA